jgi:carboxypeptidase PM20D1
MARLDDERFSLLSGLIGYYFKGAALLPAVLTGGTDTKHYADMCDAIFRFVPVELPQEISAGVHGINERIPVESYRSMVCFYIEFMRSASVMGA